MDIIAAAARPVNEPVPSAAELALADRLAHEADGNDPDTYSAGWNLPEPPAEEVELEPAIPRRSLLAALAMVAAPGLVDAAPAPSLPALVGTGRLYGSRASFHVLGPNHAMPQVLDGDTVHEPIKLSCGYILVIVGHTWDDQDEQWARSKGEALFWEK